MLDIKQAKMPRPLVDTRSRILRPSLLFPVADASGSSVVNRCVLEVYCRVNGCLCTFGLLLVWQRTGSGCRVSLVAFGRAAIPLEGGWVGAPQLKFT